MKEESKDRKAELIRAIREINKTATAEFLAGFSEKELGEYLKHLNEISSVTGGERE